MHQRYAGFLSRFSPLILAFALSGLLLGTWMKVASAQNSDPTLTKEFEVPYAFSEEPAAPDPIEIKPALNFKPGHEPAEPLAPYGLKIVKSWIPQTFTVGSNNRYIINVSRETTGTITSTLIVEDQLPDGLTWTPPTTAGKWDCTTSTSTHVSCFYADSISQTQLTFDPINIIVNIPINFTSEKITNTIRLFYGGTFAPTDVYTAVTPFRSADLLIRKIHTPLIIPSTDTPITYTINITNNGPSSASNVYVTETLSTDLKPITIWTTTAGNFDPITSRWTLNTLISGQRETLIIRAIPKHNAYGRLITNTVRAFSATRDWNTSNNTASSSFMVGGLLIEKMVSTSSEFSGKPFEFSILITNPSVTWIGATVKDIFPTTLDIIDCDILMVPGSTKCYVTNRILHSYVYIPAGQVYRFNITARGNQNIGDIPKIITNTATVSWGSPSFTLNSNEVSILVYSGEFFQFINNYLIPIFQTEESPGSE